MSVLERAREIAEFLHIPQEQAVVRLSLGFAHQHKQVNDDFRRANPRTDAELLAWYRTMDAYIWELSAYHADAGFNYAGMCQGIAERLKAAGVDSVLCLGDGIGDLTLTLRTAGFNAVYHDLHESLTAQFARYRNLLHAPRFESLMTAGWEPELGELGFDSVVSLDFMEHVTSVPAWLKAIKATLKPGGYLCAQNAFACGSGADGSIPCHLKVNDIYAYAISPAGELVGYNGPYLAEWAAIIAEYAPQGTEGMALWDWILIRVLGFVQESSNWYRRGE